MAQMDKEEMTALAPYTIKDLIALDPNFDLLYLEEDDTVGTALTKLQQKGVSSAPVKRKDDWHMLGSVDVLDLVCFVATKFAKVSLNVQESYRQMNEFASKPVKDLLGISARNKWTPVPYQKPLLELIGLLSSSRRHRAPIVNENKELIGYVTQSHVGKFLYDHRSELPKNMSVPVSSLILGRKPICVNKADFVIKAFEKIWQDQVTGLAVVDDNNKLVGAISASDLKLLHVTPVGPLIHDLYQPIQSFKHIHTDTADKIRSGEPFRPPITVKPSDTLATALKQMLDNHVHRVFVVDESSTLVGVLSLSDVMEQFEVPEFAS